jgi:hypothetical protein
MPGLAHDGRGDELPQVGKKSRRSRRVKAQAGRELDQDRPQLIAQALHLIGKSRELRLTPDEPTDVRHPFGRLDGKAKIGRRRLRPTRIRFPLMGPIERGINFDGIEPQRITLQMRAIPRKLGCKSTVQRPTGAT